MGDQAPYWDFMDSTPTSFGHREGPFQSHQTVQNHGDQDQVHPGPSSHYAPQMTWPLIQPSIGEEGYGTGLFRALSEVDLVDFSPIVESSRLERGESSAGTLFKHGEYRLTKSEDCVTSPVEKSTRSEDVKRPKRTRSAETHNRSERRRRDRISGKLKRLQELIPNCHKANQAAMLDEAIHYVKTLKQQVEAQELSMGRSILDQPAFKMSPVVQYPQPVQIPQYAPSLPMWPRMGLHMGMPLPTPNLFPSSTVNNFMPFVDFGPGLPLAHRQVAFNPLQPSLASTPVQPQLLPNYNPRAFNLPNQVGYSYSPQNVSTNVACDQLNHMMATSQESTNSSFIALQRGSQVDRTSSSSGSTTADVHNPKPKATQIWKCGSGSGLHTPQRILET